MHIKGRERHRHIIFPSKISGVIKEINADRLEEPSCAFAQVGDKVTIKWLTVGGIDI
jgi:hypothetical protein